MAEDEIMMPVGKPEAQAMAEIHALRQVGDAVAAQSRMFSDFMTGVIKAQEALTKSIDAMRGDVQTMDRRLTRVEEQKHGRDIEKLSGELKEASARINTLESNLDQAKGAKAFFEWLRTATPWLFALVVGGAAYFGWKPGAS